MIKVRVPATSANMGPGFDTMGVALNMYNHFYIQRRRNRYLAVQGGCQ